MPVKKCANEAVIVQVTLCNLLGKTVYTINPTALYKHNHKVKLWFELYFRTKTPFSGFGPLDSYVQ